MKNNVFAHDMGDEWNIADREVSVETFQLPPIPPPVLPPCSEPKQACNNAIFGIVSKSDSPNEDVYSVGIQDQQFKGNQTVINHTKNTRKLINTHAKEESNGCMKNVQSCKHENTHREMYSDVIGGTVWKELKLSSHCSGFQYYHDSASSRLSNVIESDNIEIPLMSGSHGPINESTGDQYNQQKNNLSCNFSDNFCPPTAPDISSEYGTHAYSSEAQNVRDALGCSLEEAQCALDQNQNDMDQAAINILLTKPNPPSTPPKLIPEEFECSITMEIMKDPVVAADGYSYERSAIEEWLRNHRTSPKTNVHLSHDILTPNHVLRTMIENYCSNNSRSRNYEIPHNKL